MPSSWLAGFETTIEKTINFFLSTHTHTHTHTLTLLLSNEYTQPFGPDQSVCCSDSDQIQVLKFPSISVDDREAAILGVGVGTVSELERVCASTETNLLNLCDGNCVCVCVCVGGGYK